MKSDRQTLAQSALLLTAALVSGCGHDSFPTTPTPLATAPVVLQGTRYQGSLTLATGATTAFNMTLIARGLSTPSSLPSSPRRSVQATGPVTVTGSFETGNGLSGSVQGSLIGSLDDGYFDGSLTADTAGRTDEQQYTGHVTSSSAALVAGECLRGDCGGDGLGGAVQATQTTLGAPAPPSCSYSLSPTSASFSASGGAATTTISTGPGCAWSALSTVPWVTIVGTATGTGTGILSYDVQGNAGDARSGSIRAAGQTLTLAQNPPASTPPPSPPPPPPTAPAAPAITAQPQSRTIASGATAQLSVQATGTAPLTYQWYSGASGNTAGPMPGATASSFTTPALTATTNYWVRVTNSVNHADSATATITVTTEPIPAITAEPQSQTITRGASVTLSVTATSATPLTYQWFTGASGTTANPIAGANASSFTAQPASTTSYWVRVSNSSGSVNSATATVTVPDLPVITTQPQSQTIASGSRVTLNVAASGTGPFTYQWHAGASGTTNPIGGATAPTFTTPVLTTTTSYWVAVSNGAGSVNSSTATITVSPAGRAALTFSFSPNPVSPDATPNSACPGFTRTWTYDLTIANAAGAGPFTVTSWTFNFLSGQVLNFTVQQFLDFFRVTTPTIPSGGRVVGRLCVGSNATTNSLTHTFNGADESQFTTPSVQLAAF